MKNFQFTPSYYEWHLTDQCGNILHNMVDPSEDLFHEDGTPLSKDEIFAIVSADLNAADRNYHENRAYNGILLENTLTAIQLKQAADIITEALYNYYLA